jgi:hypothetical protein
MSAAGAALFGCHDVPVVTDALLLWLMTFVGLLAVGGFVLVILRGITGRRWSMWTVLRQATLGAAALSLPIWLLLLTRG